MEILSICLVGLVAIEHVYILILEMFLWTHPKGLKTFNMTKSQAESTAVLAKNQGLYNGFLASGLLWSLLHSNIEFQFQLKIFFLSCVLVAAIYGSKTVGRRILMVQGTPAILALVAVLANKFLGN